MLVDNSIVVIENIYRLRKEGVPVKEAAITGARGVAGAITSSTLTTISVIPADRIHDRAYKTALCGYGTNHRLLSGSQPDRSGDICANDVSWSTQQSHTKR